MNADLNNQDGELGKKNNYENVKLPESIAVKQSLESYCLHISDDSMSGIIEPGDMLIVDVKKPVNDGDIVLFYYQGNLIVRRLVSNTLKANNPDYADIQVKDADNFLGKVTTCIKNLEN